MLLGRRRLRGGPRPRLVRQRAGPARRPGCSGPTPAFCAATLVWLALLRAASDTRPFACCRRWRCPFRQRLLFDLSLGRADLRRGAVRAGPLRPAADRRSSTSTRSRSARSGFAASRGTARARLAALPRGAGARRPRPPSLLWAARVRARHAGLHGRLPLDHGARERGVRRAFVPPADRRALRGVGPDRSVPRGVVRGRAAAPRLLALHLAVHVAHRQPVRARRARGAPGVRAVRRDGASRRRCSSRRSCPAAARAAPGRCSSCSRACFSTTRASAWPPITCWRSGPCRSRSRWADSCGSRRSRARRCWRV